MTNRALKHLKPFIIDLLDSHSVSESATVAVTSYLKGLAILAVVVLHYTGALFTDNVAQSAYLTVSVFFVLSGYGIFYSLESRVRRHGMTGRMLLGFWTSRAVRILPLLWLALLLDHLVGGRSYSLADFLGNPVLVSPFIYWFVSYVIQCYLGAPFLFVLLKRVRCRVYVVLVLALLAMGYAVSVTRFADVMVFRYDHLFLGHIVLFSLGMAIPMMVSDREALSANKFTTLVSFGSFLLILSLSLPAVTPLSTLPVYLAPLLLLSAFALCLSAIWVNQRLPFMGIIAVVGTYSYSVYLFHLIFFFALLRYGIVEVRIGSLTSVVYIIVLFPAFFFVCLVAEKLTTKGSDYLVARASRAFRLAEIS